MAVRVVWELVTGSPVRPAVVLVRQCGAKACVAPGHHLEVHRAVQQAEAASMGAVAEPTKPPGSTRHNSPEPGKWGTLIHTVFTQIRV